MKHINNFSKVLQHTLRVVIFCSFFLLLSNVSEATHYRYGSMSWEKVSGNTYRITISQAWRKSFFPNVVGGGIVNTGVLDLGDGSSTPVLLKVCSRNCFAYALGVMPTRRVNTRWKWKELIDTSAARSLSEGGDGRSLSRRSRREPLPCAVRFCSSHPERSGARAGQTGRQ